MNILLLNGHGGNPWDIGAPGCGYHEADLVRECTDRVEAELKKYANVYRYPKNRNAFQDIENGDFRKVLLANFKGIKFDYAFERHFNAFNGKAYGTECYVTSAEEGITVEQAIMKRMGKYFTLRDNDSIFDGVKRTNFLVIQTLKAMGISGALLETCFIDNPNDMAIWEENKAAIDHDIVMGIVEGWGLGDAADDVKPTPAPTPAPTPEEPKYDTSTITVGATVRIKSSATNYVTGQSIPGWVKNKSYTVMQVATGKVLLKEIMSWVRTADIEGQESASSDTGVYLGKTVKIKSSASTYATGEHIPNWVKGNPYTIMQIGNGKVLLKEIMSWVRTSDVD